MALFSSSVMINEIWSGDCKDCFEIILLCDWIIESYRLCLTDDFLETILSYFDFTESSKSPKLFSWLLMAIEEAIPDFSDLRSLICRNSSFSNFIFSG